MKLSIANLAIISNSLADITFLITLHFASNLSFFSLITLFYLQKTVVNDFVIPDKNSRTSEEHRGRHFQIMYDLAQNQYSIKDLGVGYGVFVR